MTDMTVTNKTNDNIWFGPLCLPGGIGQTLVVDITTNESLYLNDDSVASVLNNYYFTHRIDVTNPPDPFPRPTGIPQLLHGDGTPNGAIFATQGSAYLRRDNTGGSGVLYVKTTDVTSSVGWAPLSTEAIAAPTGVIQAFGGSIAPTTDWLLCDGTSYLRATYPDLFTAIGTTFGSVDGTHFNVPDLQGRVPVGVAPTGHTDVQQRGNNEGSSLANRRPRHPHSNSLSASDSGHHHDQQRQVVQLTGGGGTYYAIIGDGSDGDSGVQTTTSYASIGISGSIGAAGTANDAPAYLVVNYIIKT